MCGVVDFVGISLPRCLGSAPRLLGRVRLLLRLGSSERPVGTPEALSSAGLQWFPLHGCLEFCILAAYVLSLRCTCIVVSVCGMVTFCVLQCLALQPVSVCLYHGFSFLVLKLPIPFLPEPRRVHEISLRSFFQEDANMDIFRISYGKHVFVS